MAEAEETTTAIAAEPAAPETAAEPAAPEAAHPTGVQEEGAADPQQETSPPDLSDALSQLRDLNTRLDRAGVPSAQDEEPSLGPLIGQPGDDYYDEPGYEEPGQQPQGQLSPEEEQAQQVQQMLQEAIRQQVEPIFMQQEMERRTESIQQFAQENPQLMNDANVRTRVEEELSVLDPNFGTEGYAPDPRVLAIAYRSVQAELAMQGNGQQTSPSPEGQGQDTAAAVGQGATLETGAGPSAPTPATDPQDEAWSQALTRRGSSNQFGF